MTMWLVRAGKAGEREKLALDSNSAIIGWEELPDLSPCTRREALQALLERTYPDEKPKRLMNWESQIWPSRDTIRIGDLVVLPLKTRADVAFGTVTGGYKYRPDLPSGPLHTRPVEWLREFPRTAFDKDLLFSFGAFMTVCRIERNQAEQRVEAMFDGRKWTPQSMQSAPKLHGSSSEPTAYKTDEHALPDIEEQSQDLIREQIAQRYKGHALATLIAAVLEARDIAPGPRSLGLTAAWTSRPGAAPLGSMHLA
jgi:restriction system protein